MLGKGYLVTKVVVNIESEEVILLLFVVLLFTLRFNEMNITLTVKNSSVIFISIVGFSICMKPLAFKRHAN